VLISDEPFEIEELDASNYSEKQYFGSKSMLEGYNQKDHNKKNTQNLPATDGNSATQAKSNQHD